MRDFLCPRCGLRLAFENSQCLGCGSPLGFDLDSLALLVLEPGDGFRRCANAEIATCNWIVRADASATLCRSCRLTRTRPPDDDTVGLPEFAAAEAAKRRLIVELTELALPITGRDDDPERGLCFDLLSSVAGPVTTGHADGVITLDLAESDDVHREQLRISMDEPYRTLLGHFRHEIGHYYFLVLASSGEPREEFEQLFGDPDADYQAALDRHYREGAPADWSDSFISSYAAMHPAEDWAETFAHYLHIRDTIDTAAAFGLAPAGATLDKPLATAAGFDHIIGIWLPLTWALNMVNRSMGHPDLYPFVLSNAVLDKMRLVHRLVTGAAERPNDPRLLSTA
ncbi:MAG TPA: putative zinc-binding metallopeptidase [Mycobacteriales bacterium]|nr:putative zinc-binding metallopeptidase [Mycobacteriales bacterium]